MRKYILGLMLTMLALTGYGKCDWSNVRLTQQNSRNEYRFYLNSDDGSRLYINDEMIVDNDGGHGPLERVGNVELKPGLHKIMVDYHNQNGGGWLDAFYKGPGIPKQIIPANKLFLK